MTDPELLDRGYRAIMSRVVERGEAHHFTELGRELDVGLESAKNLIHELVATTPGWTHPGTDLLASFPPFNLQPTQYRVSIDGEQGWFAQCGLEATAIRWLVPGQTVQITAPCLCCGDPMTIEMCDDDIVGVEPEGIVGYSSAEIGGDAASRPFR